MKFMKRAQIYKGNNITFNPKTMDAVSYNWWRFAARIDGLVVFNDFRYSVTTAKQQRKVAGLMHELGIKVDLTLTLPRGIRHDQTLAELVLECEEHLCEKFLEAELKREERNEKSRVKRLKAKLEEYLETQVHFRDYDVASRKDFGNPIIATKVAVHQVVDRESLERDVENALHSFHRDGFGSVVFYV